MLDSKFFNENFPTSKQNEFKNSCAEFIIRLAEKLNISYSFTMLAIHLTNFFFYKKSFKQYDRFKICAAGLVLACKILDFHIDLQNVSSKYYGLHCDLISKKKKEIITKTLTDVIKEKICEAEEDLMSCLQYDLDINVATKFLPELMNVFVEHKFKDRVFHLSKIIALNFYRTGHSLFYTAAEIMVSCIFLANFVYTSIAY
jgi:hypothetical protein